MNLFHHNSRTSSSRLQDRGQRAFTMIEIALAIGVIGFALVAIIGLLPAGLNVQKDNREDTIVSQDAPYFLNAIRNGERRNNHSFFTNYVETIIITHVTDGATNFSTNYNETLLGPSPNNFLIADSNIVGLLSTPEYDSRLTNTSTGIINTTNEVTAIVRAMTGSATEQGGANGIMAFRYAMTVEVVPWTTYGFELTNYLGTTDPVEYTFLSNRWYEAQFESEYLTNSMHEVRLKFSWPVLPDGTTGPNHQTYRTVVSGHLSLSNNPPEPFYWYFDPNAFSSNIVSAGL